MCGYSAASSATIPATRRICPDATRLAAVQVADPVILSARLIEPCDRCKCDCCCCGCCCNIPECICNRYGGGFCDDEDNKIVLVTLGIFTIVQLVRNVQMLVPVYDYCMPCKECCPTTDNPCDLFKKMCFPVNEFFPPTEDGRGGCCEKK